MQVLSGILGGMGGGGVPRGNDEIIPQGSRFPGDPGSGGIGGGPGPVPGQTSGGGWDEKITWEQLQRLKDALPAVRGF